MKTGVPVMRTGVLCNENRLFPVWKTSQGKPCSGPVLALYGIAVCVLINNFNTTAFLNLALPVQQFKRNYIALMLQKPFRAGLRDSLMS